MQNQFFFLACSTWRREKLPDAQHQFERVLKLNTRYPKAHVQLGHLALRLGDAKKALDEATQEQSINPDLPDGYLLAAEAFFTLRQFSNCAGQYERAVQKARTRCQYSDPYGALLPSRWIAGFDPNHFCIRRKV